MNILIMAGGKGNRFWPKSQDNKPKQFLPLISDQTMLQLTYERFRNHFKPESIYVVTPKEYVSIVLEQLPECTEQQVIIEPTSRDTGPCVALAARLFLERGDDDVMVIAPSDHYISDGTALADTLRIAEIGARHKGHIVTLGIIPNRIEAGFGYMLTSAQKEDGRNEPIQDRFLKVNRFIEKPPLELAEKLIGQEGTLWNSGIFLWRPSTIATLMSVHQPELWGALLDIQSISDNYRKLQPISIDYAILEKAESVYTVPADFRWDDVGSWGYLSRTQSSDSFDNIIQGDVITAYTTNCTVVSDRQTRVVGVSDLIIVSTEHGLLVCHKDMEADIKKHMKP